MGGRHSVSYDDEAKRYINIYAIEEELNSKNEIVGTKHYEFTACSNLE